MFIGLPCDDVEGKLTAKVACDATNFSAFHVVTTEYGGHCTRLAEKENLLKLGHIHEVSKIVFDDDVVERLLEMSVEMCDGFCILACKVANDLRRLDARL